MSSRPPHSSTLALYAVSELNQMVGSLLGDCFPMLQVVGEISNLCFARSGHGYFSLKDSKAQVRCVFFQGKYRANHLELADGMQVVVWAHIRLYEPRGEFQLVIEQIESVGEGALRRKFEALKNKLANEGLFEDARKQTLPTFPETIGVITSPVGAALQDILSILKRRFPTIPVIIYPSLVQGEAAASQIASQLAVANYRSECDVLIVARGGGSIEDLWPFNEEIVARAIAASRIPTISAVGHETDITISDFVADRRAATPSAAAELVSPDQTSWLRSLDQFELRLSRGIHACLEHYRQVMMHLNSRLKHPKQRLQTHWQHLDELEQRLQRALQKKLDYQYHQLHSLARALNAVNPLATLDRGYALVMSQTQKKVIQNTDQVKIGETVIAQLSKGKLECQVIKRLKNSE